MGYRDVSNGTQIPIWIVLAKSFSRVILDWLSNFFLLNFKVYQLMWISDKNKCKYVSNFIVNNYNRPYDLLHEHHYDSMRNLFEIFFQGNFGFDLQ